MFCHVKLQPPPRKKIKDLRGKRLINSTLREAGENKKMTYQAPKTPDKVSTEPIIRIIEMHKWFGEFHVLKDINLSVNKGERIVICGPSGSGKSTLIRCINRLEEHQRGKIIVDNIELTNDIKNIEKIRVEVGMVFQHFNLFPHLTILENLTLGPIWVRKLPAPKPKTSPCIFSKRCISPNRPQNTPDSYRAASSSVSPLPEAFV